ncbi:MAG: hypothetical protein LW854_18960 [Rubrivivax sp.]|jgi:hypothetical protein|nr:hypothetical protein [Rubrivivax sp.]
MPAPASAIFSAAARVAAQNSLLALVDAGSGAGKLRVRNSADTLLWEAPFTNPAGTVNGTTGILTITFPAGTVNAVATGTAAYGEVTDDANTVIWSAPAEAGSAAVNGKVVLNTLSVVSGSPITPVSLVFDPN